MEVNAISTGLFSRRRKVDPPRRRRVEEVLSNVELEAYNLATIKIQSGDHVFPEIPRHIHQACSSCIVNSQAVMYPHYRLLGSHSCFSLPTSNKSNPFFVRLAPELFYYLRLPDAFGQRKPIAPEEVKRITISMQESGKLRPEPMDVELVQKFASLFGSGPSGLSTWISTLLTKIAGWILGKVFAGMFEAVCVHHGELEMVRVALETGLPVIFVPLHRSHLDSFLISWSLMSNGLPCPYFVADHSLMNTPILGKVAKWFGGLGCSQRQGYEDICYQTPEVNAALPSYFSLLWQNGNSVIFPVEPHRSRNGKPATTIVGREFFNILLKLYEDKKIEDAFVIPVSVSYDILPEEDILRSYNVSDPQAPSFRPWLTRFFQNKGFTRIAFSQPFRFREFKWSQSSQTARYSKENDEYEFPLSDTASSTVIGADFQWYKRNGSVISLSSIYGETDEIEASKNDLMKVDALLNHGFYDAAESSIFMSTHLVAFLLLKKHREGMSMENLVLETEELKGHIRESKRDVGFTGETVVVVERAIQLLRSCITKVKINGEVYVKPDLKKSSLVKLNYYASHVMPLFVMQGIVSIAVFQLANPAISLHADIQYRDQEFSILESELVGVAAELAEIFKTEFLLHAPCLTTADAILQTVEKMKEDGIFRLSDVTTAKHYIEEEDFYDYDSDGNPMPSGSLQYTYKIKLSTSSESLGLLTYYKDLLVPHLQFYAFAVQQLKVLAPSSGVVTEYEDGMEDMELRKRIYDAVQKQVERNVFHFEEYVTMDMIRNFLNLMTKMGVIEFYADSSSQWKKVHCLKPDFSSADKLDSLSASIFKFCYW